MANLFNYLGGIVLSGIDQDNDGSDATCDCNDNDAAIYPGATEVCNGIDDDCDGQIDEGITQNYYPDADGDGYGDSSASPQYTCSPPSGWVTDNTDCDDTDPNVNPGMPEILGNGIDDNCDGLVDILPYCPPAIDNPCNYMYITNVTLGDINNTTGCSSGYSQYLNLNTTLVPGDTYTVYVSGGGSFNQYASVFIDWTLDGDFTDPGEEVINSLYFTYYGTGGATFTVPSSQGNGSYAMRVISDYQYSYNTGSPCSSTYGEAEDYTVIIGSACADADGDGYDDATCGGDDCDDSDANIHPGATEICDGIDNDCDGLIDSADPGLVDNTPPSVTCKPATAALDANGSASITPSDVYDSGSDNCGTVNLVSVSPNAFDCGDLGANTVTLTVNDGNGNTATCTATVTVADNEAPTITCPAAVSSTADTGVCEATGVALGTASGADNCGTPSFTNDAPSAFPVGTTTVTWTADDGNGNTTTCTQTVTVTDDEDPTVTCQSHTAVLDGSGSASITMSDVYASGSDNCGTVNLVNVTPNTFDCNDLGANTVTLFVNDGNGNFANCTATVTVVDNTAPTATCKAATVALDA
ncbi:MAG: MopE-related protein, partial [Saprospiraceae bacterium]